MKYSEQAGWDSTEAGPPMRMSNQETFPARAQEYFGQHRNYWHWHGHIGRDWTLYHGFRRKGGEMASPILCPTCGKPLVFTAYHSVCCGWRFRTAWGEVERYERAQAREPQARERSSPQWRNTTKWLRKEST